MGIPDISASLSVMANFVVSYTIMQNDNLFDAVSAI